MFAETPMYRFLKLLLLLIVFAFCAFAEVQKMQDAPIKSRILSKQINRISIKNDRIESVSGLEAAFHFERNEKTGDGYIRPTEENGHEPIAISLTTVSGRVQELVLSVDDGEPNVLILENEEVSNSLVEEHDEISSDNGNTTSGSDYATLVVQAMKRLISGEGVKVINLHKTPKMKRQEFNIDFVEAYEVAGFVGYKFKVVLQKSNSSDVVMALKESDFLKEGDIALSFSDLYISKETPVFLYVLRRA
jgi:uncharacterized protein (DUF2249 family)